MWDVTILIPLERDAEWSSWDPWIESVGTALTDLGVRRWVDWEHFELRFSVTVDAPTRLAAIGIATGQMWDTFRRCKVPDDDIADMAERHHVSCTRARR